ncbi:MAG: sigma-70 family RNA polymerase sigma factor [Ilumatobacter sp.]|uniref:RNA polymerase sigma factor n=1 Tax=Ilumatobacter sp. TaxID=1967498 RepID=UPI0026131474|nr:sigma-70 family RNA polymerase sigma factor [Ilumatobacter sp.]MDJ0769142.1 sigma-70 family RNA polymerase sigma factor [Ilumatobacter sp.]
MERAQHPDVADADTLDRARSGDVDALADLWIVYQPQLLGLLRGRGRTAAEDIASQVWIDVRRSIDRFAGDGDAFRRWIFTIAGRRSIDEARRAQRQATAVEAERSTLVAPAHAGFEDSLDSVMTWLRVLQPDAAEVVALRVIHDLPVAQVAELTGQSEANVRVLTHRALGRLRRLLDEPGQGLTAALPAPSVT